VAHRARRAKRRTRSTKSALHQQLRRAISKLNGNAAPRDASVHEVRKELKRARSELRLLREAIGETAYRRANRQLRDAARPLSRVRDAKVLLDLVAKLRSGTRKAAHRKELESVEQQLRRERQRARNEVLRRPRLRTIRRSIESVLSGSRAWRAPDDASLRRGIERIYRKGRKAFAAADQDTCDETLHESRKQTKYLRQALELLAPAGRGHMKKRVKRAESIVDALGHDHDLAVAREKLASRSRSGSAKQELLALIERRREKLQRKAAKESRRLYRQKPEAFVNSVSGTK
jgi:CHAD domain-containing protein